MIKKYLINNTKFFYGWIIVFGGFFASASYGVFHSLGVFFKPLQQEFGWSASAISSIHSVHMFVFAVTTLFMGIMVDRYGVRKSFSLCAILIGLGFILCSTVKELWHFYLFYMIATTGVGVTTALPVSIVQKWFTKKKGFAMGIVLSGFGSGPLILAPTVNYLISRFGWRLSYLITGGSVMLILLLIAQVMVERPEDIGLQPLGEEYLGLDREGQLETEHVMALSKTEWSTRDAIKTRAFILLAIIWMISALPIHMMLIHIVPFAIGIGISKGSAAALLGLIGGLSIAGRLLSGIFDDLWGWVRTLIVANLVSMIAILWLLVVNNYVMILAFAVLYGLSWGARVPQIPGLLGNYFGTKNLTELLGFVWAMAAFGGIFGPLIGGFVFDITGSYTIAFLFAAACFGISGILAFFLKKPKLPYLSADEHLEKANL